MLAQSDGVEPAFAAMRPCGSRRLSIAAAIAASWSTWAPVAAAVVAVAEEVSLRGITDPRRIAEELWPATPIDAGYDALADALEADGPGVAPVVRRLRLADALERALRADPLLPTELRAEGWRPARLRAEWLQRWKELPEDGFAVFGGWIADGADDR